MLKPIAKAVFATFVLWQAGQYYQNCNMLEECTTYLDTQIKVGGNIVYSSDSTHVDADVCQEKIDQLFEDANSADSERKSAAMQAASETYQRIRWHLMQCLPEGVCPNIGGCP